MVSVSIIICTRNRAPELKGTLAALGQVTVPPNVTAELVVVDNGSRDNTSSVVQAADWLGVKVRHLIEPTAGQCHARNTGIAEAKGELVVFTDDDVVPNADWLQKLLPPLLNGRCDAVTGGITLAPELERPWMTAAHRWWLGSSSDAEPRNGVRELIGANMAFRRAVLQRVPAFDTELGPGALGFADDTLFGWQLDRAKFKIEFIPEANVVHRPDPARLRRVDWLAAARNRGRSEAYLRYHWEHNDLRFPQLSEGYYRAKLHARRIVKPPPAMDSEGCPLWEMSYVLHAAMSRQFRIEQARPRNYAKHGLVKTAAIESNIQVVPGVSTGFSERRKADVTVT